MRERFLLKFSFSPLLIFLYAWYHNTLQNVMAEKQNKWPIYFVLRENFIYVHIYICSTSRKYNTYLHNKQCEKIFIASYFVIIPNGNWVCRRFLFPEKQYLGFHNRAIWGGGRFSLYTNETRALPVVKQQLLGFTRGSWLTTFVTLWSDDTKRPSREPHHFLSN